jgi:CheY-like chemotaxis protein
VLIDEYNVSLEENGQSALAAALADLPDLIITDLMMPRFDGERCRVRAAPDFPHVPVLVLSAHGSTTCCAPTCSKPWSRTTSPKPFSPELRARVRNLVAVKRTVDILQEGAELPGLGRLQLTANLVESRKSLQKSLLALSFRPPLAGPLRQHRSGHRAGRPGGRILSANPALHVGYGKDEIGGVAGGHHRRIPAPHDREERSGLFDGALPNYQIQKR